MHTTPFSSEIQRYLTDETLSTLLKKHPEQLALLERYNKIVNYRYKEGVVGREVQKPDYKLTVSGCNKYQGKYAVTFALQVSPLTTPVIRFTLDLYPECCALHQLNGFHYADNFIHEPFFFEFISQCRQAYANCLNQPRRLMLNFVEASRSDMFHPNDKVPRVDNERIRYPLWYKWANQYPKQETLFVNHNTGNIIHNVIINLQ